MPDPEQLARQEIDSLLGPCGWTVQDKRAVNLAASRGVAVRELSFKGGEPDYTLFGDGKATGTVEAKRLAKAYRLRCKPAVAHPAFLELVLNAPHIVDEVNKIKKGISDSGVNLTQKRFGELLVPLPVLAGQTRVVAEVERSLSVVEEVESVVNANLRRATRLRQSILQRAFEGTLLIKTKFDAANPPSQGFPFAAEPKASYGPSRR